LDELNQDLKYRFWNKEQLETEIQMKPHATQLFIGESDPIIHIEQCVTQWQVVDIPSLFWVKLFPHSLGPIPKAWFIHKETRRQTSDWRTLAAQFCKDFSFTSKYPELEPILQNIKELLSTTNNDKRSNFVVCLRHTQEFKTKIHLPVIRNPIECYHIIKSSESLDELEELRNPAIKETEENKEIQNTIPSETDSSYNQPLKLQRLNIRTEEKPKIALVGD
jgi:hypothetical protein